MAIVILEGLDRTGKSTVAAYFESKGYQLIHMSAPDKALSQPGYTGPSYLDQMVDMLQKGAVNDIVLDRSHYGELVWPQIYGRKPMLSEDDFEVLREIEESIGVKRILMYDKDAEAHWQRCVDNKEPLTKAQFVRARSIYSSMGQKYGFESVTLPVFVKEYELDPEILATPVQPDSAGSQVEPDQPTAQVKSGKPRAAGVKVLDQRQLLEKANAINNILEKPILKQKGLLYDELEADIRNFLNMKLAEIFGKNTPDSNSFTKEEVAFYKAMFKRATEKEK